MPWYRTRFTQSAKFRAAKVTEIVVVFIKSDFTHQDQRREAKVGVEGVSLADGNRFPYQDRRHASAHHYRDLADLVHQFVELVGEERLRAIR